MNITIYRSASREEIQPTLLSFADGVVLERDFLDWSALKEQGLIYSRYCYDTDTDNEQGVCIRDHMCLVTPEELQDIVAITVDDKPFLIKNDATGELEYFIPPRPSGTFRTTVFPIGTAICTTDTDITDTEDDEGKAALEMLKTKFFNK